MQTPILKQEPLNWLTEISLTCSESLSMKKLLENGPLSDFDLFEEYNYLAEIVRPILSDVLVETLQRFKRSDSTALVIRGLPVDDFIVSTPKTGYLPNWATPIAVRTQFAIYGLLDILPVVYYGENRTRLIRQVVPVKTSAKNASSHGSDVTFGYHVDNPDLPLSSEKLSSTASCPEYLSLYGVRANFNVPTTLVSLSEVVDCLTLENLTLLQNPLFSIQRPASFDLTQGVSPNLPLLSYDKENGWLSRLDVENVSTAQKEAQGALMRLINLLNTQSFDCNLALDKGDFVIFKNQKTLHARRKFTPKFDGKDRWLMRMFGLNDVSRLQAISNDLPYVCKT